MFLFRNNSWNLLLYYVCTTMLTWWNQWMVLFVDTICYVSKIIWQKISNLMILDNSGIGYSRMLLFVFGFLVYCKIEPNSLASCITWFMTWSQSGRIKAVKKKKWQTIFKVFTINNISTLFFNWKIAVILFVVLFIITNVLLFNKIDWKFFLPVILALRFSIPITIHWFTQLIL